MLNIDLPIFNHLAVAFAIPPIADVFARRPSDWIFGRLPQLDSAFSFASRPDEMDDAYTGEDRYLCNRRFSEMDDA